MPPIAKDQLKYLEYVSLPDFAQRIDQIDGLQSKVDFATAYILGAAPRNDRDYPLAEIINFAKLKIADESAKLHKRYRREHGVEQDDPKRVNPYSDADQKIVLFLATP